MLQESFHTNGDAFAGREHRDRQFQYIESFRDLISNPDGFATFPALWDRMGEQDLNPTQLIQVLRLAERAASEHKNLRAGRSASEYIAHHAGTWTRMAIPFLPLFDHAQLAESLSIWGKLEAYPGDRFMQKWQACASQNDNLWDSVDVHRLYAAEEKLSPLGVLIPREIKARQFPPMARYYLEM